MAELEVQIYRLVGAEEKGESKHWKINKHLVHQLGHKMQRFVFSVTFISHLSARERERQGEKRETETEREEAERQNIIADIFTFNGQIINNCKIRSLRRISKEREPCNKKRQESIVETSTVHLLIRAPVIKIWSVLPPINTWCFTPFTATRWQPSQLVSVVIPENVITVLW